MASGARIADSPGAPRVPPRRLGFARRSAVRGVEGLLRALGGRRFYRRFFLAPGRFDVRRERVLVPGLGAGLVGFKIAQLSDLHAGPFVGAGDLEAVVDAVLRERVDLVCLTGDFVTRRWDEALGLLPDLARLRAERGVVGVFGNHDYRGRREGRIAAAFAAAGMRMLRNQCLRIDTGAGVLAVVGIEDLEEARSIDVDGARRGLRPGDVEVVLCHNPRGARPLAREGCVLVLSGHSHGHQLDLPLLRKLVPAHPGDRVEHGGTACITSRGLGVIGVPLRLRARPEIVVVELARAADAGGSAALAAGAGAR